MLRKLCFEQLPAPVTQGLEAEKAQNPLPCLTRGSPSPTTIRFNVFGRKRIGVEQLGARWRMHELGDEGQRHDAGFIIPDTDQKKTAWQCCCTNWPRPTATRYAG